MGLRMDPVGGGQFNQAIKKILEAEAQPIRTLEARKAREDTRLKLFQEFKTKVLGLDKLLTDISSFNKFRELKADLGDGGSLMSVTLDKDRAEPGQYTIEIDELAVRSSCVSNGFEDPDKPILGMGFVTMTLPNGDTKEIYVDDKSSSLRGVAALINKKGNAPVQASVIKDVSQPDNPWKLLITARKDGEGNQVDYPSFYFLDSATDFYVHDDRDAANAELLIDGFPFELASNSVPDFLPGVNIQLKQARPDQPFNLTITEDYDKIAEKVKAVVDQINQVLQFVYKQNAIDQNSDTSTTFAGDSTLQSLEYLIRNIFHEGYQAYVEETEENTLVYMSHIGIEFEKSGQITMKMDKFKKHIEENFEVVAEAFTAPGGIVEALKELLTTYTAPGEGFLTVKEKGLRMRMKELDSQIDTKTRYMDRRKENLIGQFARLEASMNDMQRQQQYLSATLPGASGGGNLVSQIAGI